jgi:hypothetical protein
VKDILRRVAEMPVWNYRLKRHTDPNVRSFGPVAQDFRLYFGLGDSDRMINAGDEIGVALAAIKGLDQELQDRDAKIASLQAQLAEQKAAIANALQSEADRVARLEAAVARLAPGAIPTREAKLTGD